MLEVGQHADDFAVVADSGVEVVRLIAELGEVGTDVPADGIFAGEVFFDEGLIYEGDERRFGVVIGIVDGAALQHGNAEGFEVSGLRYADEREELVVRRVGAAVDLDGSAGVGSV